MQVAPRSFWIVCGLTAIGATALALVPTLIDLDWNRGGELCRRVDERSWYTYTSQSGECVVRLYALLERFLLWFAIYGGALLGPCALYLALALIMRRRKHDQGARKPTARRPE